MFIQTRSVISLVYPFAFAFAVAFRLQYTLLKYKNMLHTNEQTNKQYIYTKRETSTTNTMTDLRRHTLAANDTDTKTIMDGSGKSPHDSILWNISLFVSLVRGVHVSCMFRQISKNSDKCIHQHNSVALCLTRDTLTVTAASRSWAAAAAFAYNKHGQFASQQMEMHVQLLTFVAS